MDSGQLAGITGLLRCWGKGDANALDRLTTLLYKELRHIAHHYMQNERPGNTLQPTAIVNELYLRLVDVHNIEWNSRAQFFALSAQVMRRILVDSARRRGAQKRGAAAKKIDLDDAPAIAPEQDSSLLALDKALEALSKIAPRQAQVVELRYFAGMSEKEAAEVLNTSLRTVRRDWQFAKAWLMRDLKGSG